MCIRDSDEVSTYAPRLYTMKINPEKIRDVIGKGGAVIRAITEETGTTIDIKDDGTITIASVSGEAADAARARIESITADVEVGKVYDGTVLKPVSYTHLDVYKRQVLRTAPASRMPSPSRRARWPFSRGNSLA